MVERLFDPVQLAHPRHGDRPRPDLVDGQGRTHGVGPHQTADRHGSVAGDLLDHPFQRVADDRIVAATDLPIAEHHHVAIDRRGLGVAVGVIEQGFQIGRVAEVVVLPIDEVVLAQLPGQPGDIVRPAQVLGLQDQLEPRVLGVAQAGVVGALVGAIDRDHDAIVGERLAQDRVEGLVNQVPALIERHADQDARGPVTPASRVGRRRAGVLSPPGPGPGHQPAMRVAHSLAKKGAMVSLPGSTLW